MSHLKIPGPVVTTEWLEANLSHRNLVVFEAKLVGPVKRTLAPDVGVIPHTRIFDIEVLSDHSQSVPHMMPTSEAFQKAMRELGVNEESSIVIYDEVGVYASPRARWMLKSMGHVSVAILDGGLPKWIAEKRATIATSTSTPTSVSTATPPENVIPGNFTAKPIAGYFCNADAVEAARVSKTAKIFDARSEGRFFGTAPEPRPILRSGHIPGSVNIPFPSTLKEDGTLLPIPELEKLFQPHVSHSTEPLIFSCGSGVTACVVALSAELVGYRDLCIYDGSWSEWGLPSERPVTT